MKKTAANLMAAMFVAGITKEQIASAIQYGNCKSIGQSSSSTLYAQADVLQDTCLEAGFGYAELTIDDCKKVIRKFKKDDAAHQASFRR